MIIIVMGISGSGKTTVGKALASELDMPFYDADDFHPKKNIAKMKKGIPLQDLDRKSWLETLSGNLAKWEVENGGVLACSALKEMYRVVLNSGVNNGITWLYLYGRSELIRERLANRKGHYFKPNLLSSQLADLEPPKYGWHFNIKSPVNHIVTSAVNKLRYGD